MNRNYVTNERNDSIFADSTEYYGGKKLSGFSMACVATSLIINFAIVAYAIISALAA